MVLVVRGGRVGAMKQMETFEELVQFETRKHCEFFLPYYEKRGWEVLQDNLGKNTDWDVKLMIDGKTLTIDEKARQREYGDFLAEIVQDLKTGDCGWIFKPKDYYFYASWNNIKNKEPASFYVINAPILQRFILDNWKILLPKMEISEKGWGITLFAKLSWEDLIFTKIAKRII